MSSVPLHLDLALSNDLQQLIHSAATLRGQSLDEFVLDAAAEASRRVLAGESKTVLGDRDRDRFIEILDQAAEPNDALRRAAERQANRT
jgi:uncharacterized protein (DUF1778 family)